MKISFLIQDLFQQGAQYVTAMMIRGFVAKGYNVDLIVSRVHNDLLKKGDIRPFEIPHSVNIVTLHDRHASKNILEIRRYLKTTDARAIVSMSSNYTAALALASIGLRRKPYIAYVEHSGIIGLNRSTGTELPTPKYWEYNLWQSKIINSQFNSIMAVSSGTAKGVERMNRLPANSVKVVYNPVIDEIFYQKVEKPPLHPWLKHKNIPTFVAAGAHSEIKNHIYLFNAIKIANNKTPVRLILFGKGILTQEYKKWIVSNGMHNLISLAPHSSQLPAEIKASDGLLISSNLESFSLVLVEALAAEVPIISTNCPYGPPELLKNGLYGTLVPVNNPEALSGAIVNQIQNPRPPAPKESWEPYTLDQVVEAYEKALSLNT